ncbi:hypothetical protein [Aliiroseovarius sp.]|uniref:hypothetical protein n=1 Tax=Aliiroseovarius sp. TaxID=1872442 RepID=UPI00263082CC|nr:hypothetical protein [Aliiroseovarius sp.]
MTNSRTTGGFISRMDPRSGVEWRARVEGPDRATVLHPDTGDAVARIAMRPDGTPAFDVLDPETGQATESSPCTRSCPHGCNGDFERATNCALACTARLIA